MTDEAGFFQAQLGAFYVQSAGWTSASPLAGRPPSLQHKVSWSWVCSLCKQIPQSPSLFDLLHNTPERVRVSPVKFQHTRKENGRRKLRQQRLANYPDTHPNHPAQRVLGTTQPRRLRDLSSLIPRLTSSRWREVSWVDEGGPVQFHMKCIHITGIHERFQENSLRVYLTCFLSEHKEKNGPAQIEQTVRGEATEIQAPDSDVVLHVPEGTYGVILGNIHTDLWNYDHLIDDDACIVSPIAEFHLFGQKLDNKKYEIQVPHCASIRSIANLQVGVWSETESEIQFFSYWDRGKVSFSVSDRFIHIRTPHFSRYIITAKKGKGLGCCCRSAEMLFFTKTPMDSTARISAFLSSLLFKLKDFRKVSLLDLQRQDCHLKIFLFVEHVSYKKSCSWHFPGACWETKCV